jgi:hypothetical protein
MAEHPSPHQLWEQAGGNGQRYRQLLREHGLLLRPGDEGYDEAPKTLPCGWPGPQRPASEWCIHDLPAGTCSECTGRGEEQPEAPDPSGYGPWFSAAYPGRCSGPCDRRIEAEDRIRADGDGGYLCSDCGREEDRP